MADTDEWIALSALQHYSYCPRQCALIHQEQVFADNVFTARGNALHQLVDQPGSDLQSGRRIERALPLSSERLGLTGRADVVEFLANGTPYPVEYKHGKRHAHDHDDLQLAAQAVCLEEMTGRPVPEGAIYHAGSRRRRTVRMTQALYEQVADTTLAIRDMLASGQLPPAANDARCKACSLIDLCQPDITTDQTRLHEARQQLFKVDD